MSYFLRPIWGYPTEVWRIEADAADRIDVSGLATWPAYARKEDATIWLTLHRRCSDWWQPDGRCPFVRTMLRPGAYHPRMARPIEPELESIELHCPDPADRNPFALGAADDIAAGLAQLAELLDRLGRLCRTIQPVSRQLDTYGHDIRELLMFASTEAEAHWRAVLNANGDARDHFTTRDYIALRAPMKLDSYSVAFTSYPSLDPFAPFAGWHSTSPTQSLRWYDAYNAVKHDRGAKLERASLQHAFQAIAAVIIMLAAQFGETDGLSQLAERGIFRFAASPAWSLSERYVWPYGEGKPDGEGRPTGWQPVPFDFGAVTSATGGS